MENSPTNVPSPDRRQPEEPGVLWINDEAQELLGNTSPSAADQQAWQELIKKIRKTGIPLDMRDLRGQEPDPKRFT